MTENINIAGWKKLEPKVQNLWRVTNGITSLVFAGLAIVPDIIIRSQNSSWRLFPFALPLFALVVIGGLTQWVVGRSYDCYRYQLGDDDLAVAKGVFWKSWRFINRNRVQHVDLTSGPIARALGLVEVSIYVGGMHTAAAVIPGLSQKDAENLRSSLVRASDVPVPVVESSPEVTAPPMQTWEPPSE